MCMVPAPQATPAELQAARRGCSLKPVPTFPVHRPQSTPWLSRCSVAHGSLRLTIDFIAAAAP